MKTPINIDIEMDRVVVENQIIKRPERFVRSQWMELWERIKGNLALQAQR